MEGLVIEAIPIERNPKNKMALLCKLNMASSFGLACSRLSSDSGDDARVNFVDPTISAEPRKGYFWLCNLLFDLLRNKRGTESLFQGIKTREGREGNRKGSGRVQKNA